MSNEFQYVSGQGRDSFPALLASFDERNQRSVLSANVELDVRYGQLARETYDLFRPQGSAPATLVYFHAGYWQSRDKANFRFIAAPFCSRGANVALVNYPLCPTVGVADIVSSACAALRHIASQTGAGSDDHPLVVCGHSAGGQLAVELALSAASDESTLPRINGIVGISGVYDLRPLVDTSLNVNLKLDEQLATRLSPVLRVRATSTQAVFAVGATETYAFRQQNELMHKAWTDKGNRSSTVVTPSDDHFSILLTLTDEKSDLFRRVLEFAAIG